MRVPVCNSVFFVGITILQVCLLVSSSNPTAISKSEITDEAVKLPPQPLPTPEGKNTTTPPPTTTPNPNTTTTSTTTPIPTTTNGTTTTTTTSTTTTTTTTPTPPTTSSTTIPPPTTKPTAAPTQKPGPDNHFDPPSFIGGMILTMGLMAIAFVSWKFYKARTERNYHTL